MKMYSFVYKLIYYFVRFLYRLKITGAENEPTEGAFIACPNHLSLCDVAIVSVSLKRQLRFLAKAELFKIPISKQFFTAVGAYPVNRGKGDVAAIKRTLEILKDGEAVGLYPQGTRYAGVDPRETKPKSGIGLIVYRSKAPVLPICIQTKKFKILPFHRVFVKIGKPITYENFGFTTGTRSEIENAANMIFNEITSMIED